MRDICFRMCSFAMNAISALSRHPLFIARVPSRVLAASSMVMSTLEISWIKPRVFKRKCGLTRVVK